MGSKSVLGAAHTLMLCAALVLMACDAEDPATPDPPEDALWRPVVDCEEFCINANDTFPPDTTGPGSDGKFFASYHVDAAWSCQGLIAYADLGLICPEETAGSVGYDIDFDLRGIWVLDPETGEKRRVVDRGRDPTWSPDATEIAFEYGHQIYVVHLADGSIRALTTEGRNFFPSWSPDGEWIAYDQSNESLWLVCPDGTSRHQVSEQVGFSVIGREPVWHPGGVTIAYRAAPIGTFTNDIYELDLVKKSTRRVARRPGIERYFGYSKDGKWIAFSSYIDEPPHVFQAWIMRRDGTDQQRLTVCGGESPSWSPDGTQIVYTKFLNKGCPEEGVLWLIDVATNRERQLTYQPICDR